MNSKTPNIHHILLHTVLLCFVIYTVLYNKLFQVQYSPKWLMMMIIKTVPFWACPLCKAAIFFLPIIQFGEMCEKNPETQTVPGLSLIYWHSYAKWCMCFICASVWGSHWGFLVRRQYLFLCLRVGLPLTPNWKIVYNCTLPYLTKSWKLAYKTNCSEMGVIMKKQTKTKCEDSSALFSMNRS